MSYVKYENGVVYYYFRNLNLMKIKCINNEDFILKVYENLNKVTIINSSTGENIYIADYTNKNDKNYKTFKKYYDKFLSKYFRDFLVV